MTDKQATNVVPTRLSTSVVLGSDPLISPRLSQLDPRRYGYGWPGYPGYSHLVPNTVGDPYHQATALAADQVIDQYVRRPDGSPVKNQDEKQAYSFSPAVAALEKAHAHVENLRQSGVNPVIATDKALADTDLLNKYGLQNSYAHLAHPYYGYGGYGGYGYGTGQPWTGDWKGYSGYPYGDWRGDWKGDLKGDWRGYGYPWTPIPSTTVQPTTTTTTTVSQPCTTECKTECKKECDKGTCDKEKDAPMRQSAIGLSDGDFYKKYGFYPYERSRYWGYGTDYKGYGTDYRGYGLDYPYHSGYYGGQYPYGGNYGYPYGGNYGSYGYPWKSSYLDPLPKPTVSTTDVKANSTGYVRQYSQPTENKSQGGSRKVSANVTDDDRFDFDGEKKGK